MITVEEFERHRPLLFGLAYRMLGRATEAEEVVQDTYLRAQRAAGEPIEKPRSYLATIATRLCLNRLQSATARRESYTGTWLPEPIFTGDPAQPDPHERAAMHDSLSIAFLVLLESLSPTERAVFLLHDVFDYSFAEVAEMVGKQAAACRQLARRARQRLRGGRPRFKPSPADHERLLRGFIEVAETGRLDDFLALLAEDVTIVPDGGGQRGAAVHVLRGRPAVAAFIQGVRRQAPDGLAYETAVMNGQRAILARTPGGQPFFALFVYGDGTHTHLMHVIAGEKLRGLNLGVIGAGD